MRFQNILPAILAVVALSGCSVYRSGQTPDDVYYSPVHEEDSYVTVDNSNNRRYNGQGDYYNPDDNYLRMRVRDPYRWSSIDDYSVMNNWQYSPGYYGYYSPFSYYNPYSYYSPFSFNAYWSSYYSWNSYYNPYCTGIIVGSPKNNPVVYSRIRNTYFVNSYSNSGYNTHNGINGTMNRYYTPGNSRSNARYNNSNSPSVGSSLRSAFSGSSSNNSRSESYYPSANDRPTRVYTPSSSSSSYPSGRSSSGGSSGGGGGSVSRPGRGG